MAHILALVNFYFSKLFFFSLANLFGLLAPKLVKMGRFKHLVDFLAKIKAFKKKYHIPQEVAL